MSSFEQKDIKDDEIRVIGSGYGKTGEHGKPRKYLWWAAAAVVVLAAALTVWYLSTDEQRGKDEPSYFEPENTRKKTVSDGSEISKDSNDSKDSNISDVSNVSEVSEVSDSAALGVVADIPEPHAYTEIIDTLINDIPLRIYIPHHAQMSLQLGRVDKSDSSIVFVAQAADVRADNGGIVGAFVLKGKPLSKGLSKKGYVASIEGKISVGVAENSPLFEEAMEKDGYFFRQYPLVADGRIVENEPRGKSVRRGICERGGSVFITESLSRESFHDFSQALVDLGVDQAVYLVGSTAYGWAKDADGQRHETGLENLRTSLPPNTSYIVWR